MNKRIVTTVFALIFFLVSYNSVFCQSVSPFTGQPVDEPALAAPFTLEVLFGISGPSPNNVLILNGINVPISYTGWFCSNGLHSTTLLNYGCGQDIMGY
ncbi:MAG: hypothetical protein K9H26_11795 [Prolixibacteraceae bacterium]|nr:hypothetical protein [Prolixibacteraceae bacterium]